MRRTYPYQSSFSWNRRAPRAVGRSSLRVNHAPSRVYACVRDARAHARSSSLQEEARVICCETVKLVERCYERNTQSGPDTRSCACSVQRHDATYTRARKRVAMIGPFLLVFIRFAANHMTMRVAAALCTSGLSGYGNRARKSYNLVPLLQSSRTR